MRVNGTTVTPEVRVTVRGEIPVEAAGRAGKKVARLFRFAPRPVLAASVRLSRNENRSVECPVVAQAGFDVSGRPVRAQVTAPNAEEAIDRLCARLRRQLERSTTYFRASRSVGLDADPGEWRHESAPAIRPPWYPRPEAEREIVRHKSYSLARSTIDEAYAEMHLLDYDFHLFTEAGSRQDSVLYHAGPTMHRLAQLTPPGPHILSPFKLAVTISPQPAPLLSTMEAVERIGLTGLPFLFFLDAERGRGSVLYHRYDGHYGLITPAA
ncbi:sigma 54 modulation/S30EA ribosomal C-terminal domain-containing protein [Amycolatopsis sp. NPDC049868]|uniref:sigma 54 modulation/S30EA ribosomal C-terminal domain-containing protein n=1 Tax=Amycolatopsis sp. NPDC049868 TaxID=3363934 RepID=UPI00379A2881